MVDPAPPAAARVGPAYRQPFTELPISPKGRYVWTEEIGRGGMGVVREARDELFGREVAVKQLLDPEDGELKARFLEEARVTAQLEHPNVVPVHDLGTLESGEVFFAMKRVRGRTLADVLDGLEEGDETERLLAVGDDPDLNERGHGPAQRDLSQRPSVDLQP